MRDAKLQSYYIAFSNSHNNISYTNRKIIVPDFGMFDSREKNVLIYKYGRIAEGNIMGYAKLSSFA